MYARAILNFLNDNSILYNLQFGFRKKYNTTRSLILSGESRDLAELMEMFPKDKNCYLGDGETLRWRALAGALHGELTPVGIPLPERTLNQTPIHGLNGKIRTGSPHR